MIKKTKTNTETTQNLTPEELAEFRKAHDDLNQSITDLGWLEINYASTKEQLDNLAGTRIDLLDRIKELNGKKQELSTKLGDKYGDKQVDLETGELK
jgi:chromosome segregation ATPase